MQRNEKRLLKALCVGALLLDVIGVFVALRFFPLELADTISKIVFFIGWALIGNIPHIIVDIFLLYQLHYHSERFHPVSLIPIAFLGYGFTSLLNADSIMMFVWLQKGSDLILLLAISISFLLWAVAKRS